MKAQHFLRLFIDKATATSPELFDDNILSKAMPMYLQLHVTEPPCIDVFPRARFNKYAYDWMKSMRNEQKKMLLGSIMNRAQKGAVKNKRITTTQMRLGIGAFCLISGNLAFSSIKHALTHPLTHSLRINEKITACS